MALLPLTASQASPPGLLFKDIFFIRIFVRLPGARHGQELRQRQE